MKNKLKETISKIIHPITGASDTQLNPIMEMIYTRDEYIKLLKNRLESYTYIGKFTKEKFEEVQEKIKKADSYIREF